MPPLRRQDIFPGPDSFPKILESKPARAMVMPGAFAGKDPAGLRNPGTIDPGAQRHRSFLGGLGPPKLRSGRAVPRRINS